MAAAPTQEAEAPPVTPALKPERKGGFLRFIKITLISIAVLAGLVAITGLLLDTVPGRRWLAEQISELEFENGLRIDIGRIDGSIYNRAIIRDLTLSDPEKAFLTLEEAKLDWRPLSWLRDKLDIRSLALRNGRLLALPEFLETDSTAPILPDFDIRLDSLTSENFVIAPAIAGEERIANITANADIRSGQVLLNLSAVLVGGDDRVIAKINVAPDDDIFDLNAEINAPADGVLARLAGLERGLQVNLTGDGSYADWQGALMARDDAQLLADLALTEQSGDYTVKGDVFPASFVSGDVAALIGDKVALDGAGNFAERTVTGRLRANLAAFAVEGQGAVDLAENEFIDLALTVSSGAKSVTAFGAGFENLSAKMLLNGNFDDWQSPLNLSASALVYGDYSASDIVVNGDISSAAGRIDSDVALAADRLVTGIELIDAILGPVTLEGDFALEDGKISSQELALKSGQLDAMFGLNGDIAANRYTLGGQLKLDDYSIENIARADISADVQLGFGAAFTAQAAIKGNSRKVVNQSLAQYVGEAIRFAGNVDYADGRPLVFRDVEIAGSQLSLLGGGRLEADGTAIVRAAGRHRDYGPFDIEAQGQGSLEQATLALADPLPALGLKNVELALAEAQEGFGVTAKGGSLIGPFSGLANILALDDGRTRIAVRELNVSATQVTGDIFTGNSGTSGNFALTGGGVNGDIVLASTQQNTSLTGDIVLANARFGGDTPILIRQGKVDVTATFGNDLPRINASLSAQGISRGNLFVGRIAANADLPGCLSAPAGSSKNCAGVVTASLAGRRGSRFDLQTQTRIERQRIAIDINGAYGRRKIATRRKAIVRKTDNGWQLSNAQLQVGRGVLDIEGLFGNDRQYVELGLQRLPLAVLDVAYSELGLSGTATGALNLDFRTGRNPIGSAKLRLNRLARSTIALTSRPVDLALNARLNDDNLAVRTIIRDKDQELGRAQMRLSNMPGNTALAERLLRADLLGEIKYNGPVDALWRLTGVEVLDITGGVSLRADARGSLNNPQVQGRLATRDARLESSLSGTVINTIAAQGRFAGDVLTLSGITGKTPNGGTLTGGGTIRFGGKQFASFDLAFNADNANLLVRDDFAATVTGRITARSEGDRGGVLGGDVFINRGRFNLGKAEALTELPDIAYREINRRADEAPPISKATPWRYAIKARAQNQIAVRGLGIDSEWSADIAINGPVNQPRISGEANLVRGEYEFAGRNFDLERGRIRFQQASPTDPLLDIVATADLADIDADIKVGGSGLRPEITFSSVPQLPEDELLARLLFGSSVTDISAPEAVQLAAAIASLRGGGGLDPINALRGAVGLDRLRIIAADPSIGQGISIGAGKYITRNVYVEVITDGQGYSATQAEFQITRWLSILSTVSTIGRQSVNARISRDY